MNGGVAKGGRGMQGIYELMASHKQARTPAPATAPGPKPLPVATVEEVQEIVIQAPPAPVQAQEPAKARPAWASPRHQLEARLDDAIQAADDALEDYLSTLEDERLNALIQTARHLRDARAALG